MKIKKNKGKVHPSPSSSSSSTTISSSSSNDMEVVVLSVLNLLPTAILALASVLSLQDREVLAYMITRSSDNNNNSFSSSSKRKTTASKQQTTNHTHHHRRSSKTPMFECECFDCYTSYWVRWDTSPNRDLIHRVIEAFEDHLNKPTRPARGRRPKTQAHQKAQSEIVIAQPVSDDEKDGVALGQVSCDTTTTITVGNDVIEENDGIILNDVNNEVEGDERNDGVEDDEVAEIVRTMVVAAVSEHKGLARKVLPDVLGLFNSRLWSLWSPNA